MAATRSSDLVADLAAFVEIPSISMDPDRRPAMRRAADWVAAKLAFANGRVVETDGHPAVLAERIVSPGAPTILVYGHYDVQPPGDETVVDDAAVRAGRARRAPVRPRRE